MFSPISRRVFIITLLLSIVVIAVNLYQQTADQRSTLVFCNVGQGDGTYLRVNNQIDVLIDAGPDQKILNCLGKHMPFYDRTIEMVIISHPHKDHVGGLDPVMRRYQIKQVVFAKNTLSSRSQIWKKILTTLQEKRIKGLVLQPPRQIKIANAVFDFFSATDSLVFLYSQNQFRVLFTGDISGVELGNLYRSSHLSRFPIDIIKIPHHGSKTGLNKTFYSLAHPTIAVISVGEKNAYGHPSPVLLELLKALKINIKRTDVNGDIMFKLKSQMSNRKTTS